MGGMMDKTIAGPVGSRCHVTLTWVGGGIRAVWDPSPPQDMTARELADYRTLRRRLVQQVADELGAAVAIAEVAPGGRLVPEVIKPRRQNDD